MANIRYDLIADFLLKMMDRQSIQNPSTEESKRIIQAEAFQYKPWLCFTNPLVGEIMFNDRKWHRGTIKARIDKAIELGFIEVIDNQTEPFFYKLCTEENIVEKIAKFTLKTRKPDLFFKTEFSHMYCNKILREDLLEAWDLFHEGNRKLRNYGLEDEGWKYMTVNQLLRSSDTNL
jgi:hypothetical protein